MNRIYKRKIFQFVFILFVFILIIACSRKNEKIKVEIYTSEGNIKLELYPTKAPGTTKNFMNYVNNEIYDGAIFYRTVKADNQPNNPIKIEVIQGGLGFNETDEEFPPIRHESTKESGILHLNGTISMARADTGTVTSEFFICINNQPELDFGGKRNTDLQGFAAFGKVTEGMEIVKLIQYQPDLNQMLIDPVSIDSIRQIK